MDTVSVTKDTMIGELLQIDANIAPILMDIGMHCLGCGASQMETIEEAAMVHGIDPTALVDAINQFLAEDLAAQAEKADQQAAE
jgi:hybrid cluster-associated redox disulfide protein